MKKFVLLLAASAFVVSCNKLADNEFEITGKIDPSLNGKNVFLEKIGDLGFVPIDTVKVEDGKFVFNGKAVDPSLHFVSVEGMPPMAKLNIILEEGEINIDFDKDTVSNSKMSGTYNNDKLHEYFVGNQKIQKKQMELQKAFAKKYEKEIQQFEQTKDTVISNRLNKLYLAENKDIVTFPKKFIADNPKAYINIYVLRELLQRRTVTPKEAQEIFAKIDESVKKTAEGKKLGDMLKEVPAAPVTPEQPKDNSSAALNKPAPRFTAPSPEGKPVALKQALGKVTIVDFWASWCKPCRAENPNVVAMYNELHSKGLNIIGVSLDKDAAAWKQAIAADKLTWSHVSNLKFWEEPIAAQYGVRSIPATFVLDAKGNIVAKDLRGDALKAKVEELLNAKS